MALKFSYTIIGDFAKSMEDASNRVARTATKTMREVGVLSKSAGRTAIAAGGFSTKWQNALRVKNYPPTGISLDPVVYLYHKIPYAAVFQTGAIIVPKAATRLWLPLPAAPRKPDGRQLSPQQYIDIVGPLAKIIRSGKSPLLVGRSAKITNRTGGGGRFGRIRTISGTRLGVRPMGQSIPLYVGISSVTIGQKFDVIGAVRREAAQIPEIYSRKMKED